MASRFCDQSFQEMEDYCFLPQFQALEYFNQTGKPNQFPVQNPSKRYCTFEIDPSSTNDLADLSNFSIYNNNNNLAVCQDSEHLSNTVNDMIRHSITEQEMLEPDSELTVPSMESTQCYSNEMDGFWRGRMDTISRRDLKHVLIACAKAVSDGDLVMCQWLIDELRPLVSVSGEPIQRLGAYLLEGLVARLASSGSSIYKSLRCRAPESSELLSYMHILYEVCPYLKFGSMSANGAIAEAMKGEKTFHIVDFQIGQGSQWISFIEAFAKRPGGPPRIRLTGIDDSMSAYARGGGLNIVGRRLAKLAEKHNVPFEFHAAAMSGCVVQPEDLKIRPGEALAVNFAFVLHHMPDESVSTENHRDSLLRMVKSLSPKVVTLIEQESNTNTAAFFLRFKETMNYYTAMFESMDVTLPRDHKERINVEQHCLARDIVNVIACEGAERVERHELLGKWKSRFQMAGFAPYPLSSLVNSTIRSLLKNYSDKYRLEERDGALFLGWMTRDLVSSCAWR